MDLAETNESAAVELFGEFARLNFAEEWPEGRRREGEAKEFEV